MLFPKLFLRLLDLSALAWICCSVFMYSYIVMTLGTQKYSTVPSLNCKEPHSPKRCRNGSLRILVTSVRWIHFVPFSV